MKSKILPAYCVSGRALKPEGVVVHYFSARSVDPGHPFELEACRNLFLDYNRPKRERQHYMREAKWPDDRMYASAHVLIGRDGIVWKLVEFDRQAYHAGKSILNGRPNCNAWTLGVELVGNITSGFTPVQYVALAELLVGLMGEYRFARDAIAGHDTVRWAAIQAGERCKKKYDVSGRYDGTGDNFEWTHLWSLVTGLEAAGPHGAEIRAPGRGGAARPLRTLPL